MNGPLPRTRTALGPAAPAARQAAQAPPARLRVRLRWPATYGALL